MKRFLIIQTAFLGDAILATAVAEQLHRKIPGAEVSILVRKGNESLFSGHPFLKEVLIWDKKNHKTAGLLSLLKTIRSNSYDAVINLQRFFSTGFLTAFSGARHRIGFDKNPLSFLFSRKIKHIIGDGRHETDRNLELVAAITGSGKQRPVLYPQQADEESARIFKTKPYVTMAPSSVWFTKQLPESKWVEMIQTAPPQLSIYLLGAPADSELCDSIIKTAGNPAAVNLSGKTGLLATASLMRDARMNYVNDSGPLHIASAVNAPVTAFFCSTLPAFGFGPLSDNRVLIETLETLSCRPCGLHGKTTCPEGHFRCATTIILPSLNTEP
jgi:ADP-heptose:LPS heptosyltransferase